MRLSSAVHNLAVRSKLLLLVAIPIVLLVGLSTRDTSKLYADKREIETFQNGARVSDAAAAAHRMLIDEREESTARALSGSSMNLAGARDAFNSSFDKFSKIASATTDVPAEVRIAADRLSTLTATLTAIRLRVDTGGISAPALSSAYDQVLVTLSDVTLAVVRSAPTVSLAETVDGARLVGQVIDDVSRERSAVAALYAVRPTGSDIGTAEQLVNADRLGLAQFNALASDTARSLLVDAAQSSAFLQVATVHQRLDNRRGAEGLGTDPARWLVASSARLKVLEEVRDAQRQAIATEASAVASAATSVLIVGLLAMAIFLAACLAMAILLSRAIARPLKLLARNATELSSGQPVTVGSYVGRDEIGQVSEGFRAMESTMVRLAIETARVEKAVQSGDFTVRADEFSFEGEWARITRRLNSTLEEVEVANERLRHDSRRQGALSELGRLILDGTPLEDILSETCRLLVDVLPVLWVAAFEIDHSFDTLVRRAFERRVGSRAEVSAVLDLEVLSSSPASVQLIAPINESSHCLAATIGSDQRRSGVILLGGDDRLASVAFRVFLGNVSQLLTEAMQRRQVEHEIVHQSLHDDLTGLPNRTFLREHLGQAVHASRHNVSVSVLSLEIDRFRPVNESYGRDVGDQILVQAAERLALVLPPHTLLARVSGAGFAVIVERLNDIEVTRLAEEIIRAFDTPFTAQHRPLYLSLSIGIVAERGGGLDPDRLLRDAETARTKAVDSGGARIERFDTSLHEDTVRRVEIEHELRRALDGSRHEFAVHFQPIISFRNGNIHGYEALVRWQHPEMGIIAPDRFIPIAEETGLITALDPHVMTQAIRTRPMIDPPIADARPLISVNLSPVELAREDLVDSISRILDTERFPPDQLCLEITETAVMSDSATFLRQLRKLRSLGVWLSIDDFGAGYSSFSYLTRLPVHFVKIDRSFVSDLGLTHNSATVVTSIISLAHDLGLEVVAEGIETLEQLTMLNDLGCDFGQGYLLCRPTASLVPNSAAAAVGPVLDLRPNAVQAHPGLLPET